MKKRTVLTFITLFYLAIQGFSQMPDTYSEGKCGRLNYGIFVPKNYDKTKSYPLVMYLHGAGNSNPTYLNWYNDIIQSQNPCFVFTPRTPNETWEGWSTWNDNHAQPMDSAIHVLDSLTTVYSIDKNRLYVYGISMGGEGTFQLLYFYPHKFAAAMSVCGGGQESWADSIASTPLWMFHGSEDVINKPEVTERIYNRLVSIGATKMRYTNYPGYGHAIWDKAASEPAWYDWMFSHSLADKDCPKPDKSIELSATKTDQINLSWNDVRDPNQKANKIWYYNIWNQTGVIGTAEFDKTNFSFTQVNSPELYKVEAVNYCSSKSDFSNTQPSGVTKITIAPIQNTLYIDIPYQFSIKAYDKNDIETIYSGTTNWSVDGGGTMATTGIITPTPKGSYTLTASTIVSGVTISATAPFLVADKPILSKIQLTPTNATVTLDDTIRIIAQGVDINNITMPVSPKWSVSAGGIIDARGLFTASKAGTFTITATVGDISNTTTVIVIVASQCTVVGKHGLLSTSGKSIVDKNNQVFSVSGMSLPWSQWAAQFYNGGVVRWMKTDFRSGVIRAAMAVESADDGYIKNPAVEKAKITTIIDTAIASGIYVIIDWHEPNAYLHTNEAINFFKEMAQKYGHFPNIIYELNNEPNGDWTKDIKPAAIKVIDAIRAIDPDNLILVGTPNSSKDPNTAADDPITGYKNIAYSLHYFVSYAGKPVRDNADAALGKGLPLFVTEWGVESNNLNGTDLASWIDFMKTRNLSNCNWTINNSVEDYSILAVGADSTGGWSEKALTPTGIKVREMIRGWDAFDYVNCSLNNLIDDVKANDNSVSLYPNPADSQIFIESIFNITQIDIYNESGVAIKSLTLNSASNAKIDVCNLPSGLYFLKVTGKNGAVTKKFIKN